MSSPNHAVQSHRILALVVMALLAVPLPGRATDPIPPGSPLESLLSGAVTRSGVQGLRPGYGLCLFDAQGPIWSHYQGDADREGRRPFSADTRFRAGAISELLTAVRVLQLVDEGKMDLGAPIGRYTPSVFGQAPPQSALGQVGRLEVGTLLSHLSGAPVELFLSYRDYRPLENIGRFLEGVHLQHPPGAKFLHAGGLIDLLGLAVQEREGRPFEAGVRAALFEPLGMTSSSFQYRDDPRNADMHYRSGQEDEYLAQITDWNEVQAPSASLVSSLRDLVPFYSMVLGQGSWGGRVIVSPESVSAMLSPKSEEVARRQGIHVGYVWMLSLPELAYLGRLAWYSGRFIAHRNVVVLAPDLGVGVAVATNSWNVSDRHVIFPLAVEVLRTYAAAALGRAPPPAPATRRVVPLPTSLGRRIAGNYVSPFGVYRVAVRRGGLAVFSNGEQPRFDYYGENLFMPDGPTEIERMVFSPPESLTAFLRNGVVVSATRPGKADQAAVWSRRRGTYRIADGADYPRVHVYAFTIAFRSGLLVIRGDDAKEYWIRPSSQRVAEIVCHPASLFDGRPLEVKSETELLLGGVPFRLSSRSAE